MTVNHQNQLDMWKNTQKVRKRVKCYRYFILLTFEPGMIHLSKHQQLRRATGAWSSIAASK